MQESESPVVVVPPSALPPVLGPEHTASLYNTLLAALDPQGGQQRREAEALLRAFEAIPNFLDVLATIIQTPDAHNDAR